MQKIMVALKRVLDYNVRVRIKSDGTGVITDGAKMSINPFDEIALEEALRIKEREKGVEVLVISIGDLLVSNSCAPAWQWARIALSWCRPIKFLSRSR